MPDRIPASLILIRIQEKLRISVPELLIGWELQEYLGVSAHLHTLYAFLFPVRERGVEVHNVVLQDAKTKRADCVGGLNAGTVGRGYGYGVFDGVVNACDVGIQEETGIVGRKESVGFAFDESVKAARVVDVVVGVAELVESCIVILAI